MFYRYNILFTYLYVIYNLNQLASHGQFANSCTESMYFSFVDVGQVDSEENHYSMIRAQRGVVEV
jgi:hypothetical protein